MKIIKYLTLLVLCFGASILICMQILDDILVRFVISDYIFLITRIVLAILLYFLVIALKNKNLSNKEISIMSITYIILVITLTLFKGDFGRGHSNINLNPLQLVKDLTLSSNTMLLVIGNIFAYIPIGIYIKYLVSIKEITLYCCFIFYCISIESIQYIFKLGFFDINDIIMNSAGFIIGAIIYKQIIKRREVL